MPFSVCLENVINVDFSVCVTLFPPRLCYSDGSLKRATFYFCQLSSDWLLLINRKWVGLLIERCVPEKTIRYLLCMTSRRDYLLIY